MPTANPGSSFVVAPVSLASCVAARRRSTQLCCIAAVASAFPPPEQPYFSDSERGKPFMMLNMYLALATTTMLANENECGSARAIEPMMRDAWQIFSQLFLDPDINADFELLTQLTINIQQTCREPIPQIVDVPFSCG